MTSMVLRLQESAHDRNIPVADLLRYAKAVATKLDLSDALEWINLELNGYANKTIDDLPPYRKVSGVPKAYNPYHGWQPIIFSNAEVQENFSKAPIATPLGELEAMLKNDDGNGTFSFPYAPKNKIALMNSMNIKLDVNLELSVGRIINIVDAVRNLILDWSLQLEKSGILGKEMTFSQEEKSEAAHVTQIFIKDSVVGTIGDVSGQAEVTASVSHGLNIAEVQALVQKIREEGSLLPQDIGPQLNDPIGELEKTLVADTPDEGRVRKLLISIRSICEGASGNLIAQSVVSSVEKILMTL